jgi:hypothetical protein
MGKTPEEAIEHLEKSWAPPGSREHEMIKAVIQAKMVERLATPRRWAFVSLGAAVASAGAAVASTIAAAL